MNEIKLFEDKEIRTVLVNGETFYAVSDVVGILAESKDPKNYWRVLKKREPQLITICNELPVVAKNGKTYKTDCANKEGLLRIIQSVPSKKAEPFKMWLAKVGSDALDEKANKRLAIHKKLKETQGLLFDNVKKRGVDKEGFERVLKSGDKALFGGKDIKKIYGIEKKEDADDYMHNLLLTGKTFGTELTNLNVQKNNLEGEERIAQDHKNNNEDIREVIKGNGYLPEDIPPEENIQKLEVKKQKRIVLNKKEADKD